MTFHDTRRSLSTGSGPFLDTRLAPLPGMGALSGPLSPPLILGSDRASGRVSKDGPAAPHDRT